MRPFSYRLAFAAAIVIVLLNAIVAYRALSGYATNVGWQTHTWQVVAEGEVLLAQVRSAESYARGYALSPDPNTKRQFDVLVQQIQASLDGLQRLTADSPSQQDRITKTRERIAIRIEHMRQGFAIRDAQPNQPLTIEQAAIMTEDNRRYGIFSVPYAILQIENEERRLLNDRTQAVEGSRRRAYLSFSVAAALDLFFICTAFFLLEKEVVSRQRISAQSEEIKLLNTDLERRVHERTLELETSNQELEAFSYSVSHDLRAPLRTIDGFSLALYEDYADKLDVEGQDYINRVRAGVQRMGQLIDALLQLSRVTRSELVNEPTDLADLARSVSIELAMNDPQRKVNFEIPSTPVLAKADPRLLRVAFENLMGNAFKFTSKTEDARIEFGSTRKDGETVYFIRDNGAGFDMYYVDRLFTAFQRLHGDRDFKGSGIGLATTLRIIRRHKGRIWAEGKENEGATFYFTLGA